MISIEFYKNNKAKDKLKITINYEEFRKAINLEPIIYDGKVNINIGYIKESLKTKHSQLNNLSLNYESFIGPVLFLFEKNKDKNASRQLNY